MWGERYRQDRLAKNAALMRAEGEFASSVPLPAWNQIHLLKTGESYFLRILDLVRNAKHSVRIESYIFELDACGKEMVEALREAAARGLKVRLVIDAIGSPDWSRDFIEDLEKVGVGVRVFGRLREIIRAAFRHFIRGKFWTAWQTLRKFQLRNHRKLVIIDEEVALVGSANIGERFSEWRESTVELRGPGVADLKRTFVRSWRLAARERLRDERVARAAVRTNFTRKERLAINQDLIRKMNGENVRLYMTTAYFHPRPRLMLALFSALKRGVDLRIISPRDSDISWFPWLSRAGFSGLIEKGAKVYEYQAVMNHSKTTIFSQFAIVGSTNMNYRSFMHDLELDVLLNSPEAVKELEVLFEEDLKHSIQLTRESIRGYVPFAFLVSFLLTPFKRWL